MYLPPYEDIRSFYCFLLICDGFRYNFPRFTIWRVSRGFGGGDKLSSNFLTTIDMIKRFGTRVDDQKRVPQLRGFVKIIIFDKVHHLDFLHVFSLWNSRKSTKSTKLVIPFTFHKIQKNFNFLLYNLFETFNAHVDTTNRYYWGCRTFFIFILCSENLQITRKITEKLNWKLHETLFFMRILVTKRLFPSSLRKKSGFPSM